MSKLKDELRITIKEEIKDAMMEFKIHILGEIRQIQKSIVIEDLDASVKENKDDIKSLLDRTSSSRNTEPRTIKNQHQRNFIIRIKGLHVPK